MNDIDPTEARSFHARLVDLLRVEFTSLAAFLEALAEFDRREHFRALGHANLFSYLHHGLKLSRAAAHHRRAAAWLVQRFPVVLKPIGEGKLCFTTAAVLASVATEENLPAVLPRFYGLSKQEALELAAELKPRPNVPTRTVVTRVEQVDAAEEGVPKIRLGELGRTRTEEASPVVERLPTERTMVEPMTGASSRMHLTVSKEFLALLKRAKGGGVAPEPWRDRRAGADRGAGGSHREAGEAPGPRSAEGEARGPGARWGQVYVAPGGRRHLRRDGTPAGRPRRSAGQGRGVHGRELQDPVPVP